VTLSKENGLRAGPEPPADWLADIAASEADAVRFTARAERQLDDLRIHFAKLDRVEAGRKMLGVFYDTADIPGRV